MSKYSGVDTILWEDLQNVLTMARQSTEALHAILSEIQNGKVDQPTHEDSQRLNRLTVLSQLLNEELRPWIAALGIDLTSQTAESAIHLHMHLPPGYEISA